MSRKGREIGDYLSDILTSICEVEEFLQGISYEAFKSDRKTVNAVIRSLEVIGEATKHIPASYRTNTPISPGAEWPA